MNIRTMDINDIIQPTIKELFTPTDVENPCRNPFGT